ncbi:cell envelope biogenesis protein OmpA [Arsenophonus endosymbiont of Aphis craccivora]|uniref:LPS translocon maturation chaperone LptM n=1 Tax=unclassified Arsenophonus TaxID=2627083 RepID=UPI0015DC803B|nr:MULTISPECIES: lipoprotein [unclassified Arsenophonus]MDR5609486.1 lipoprotein [Arsenophonus sp.]MDR5613216.1 lipoprotein [Arsenophonus sp.]QLK87556.1 cell envelope biogenesis protein OmpA [Arsenophonus endosymbiont of Aphis craccivora]
MKKLLWLFMTSIFLTLLSACGLKGPLYFPAKATAEQKTESTISSKETEHQSIQTETLQKSSNDKIAN